MRLTTERNFVDLKLRREDTQDIFAALRTVWSNRQKTDHAPQADQAEPIDGRAVFLRENDAGTSAGF